jgi:hypothetical protein
MACQEQGNDALSTEWRVNWMPALVHGVPEIDHAAHLTLLRLHLTLVPAHLLAHYIYPGMQGIIVVMDSIEFAAGADTTGMHQRCLTIRLVRQLDIGSTVKEYAHRTIPVRLYSQIQSRLPSAAIVFLGGSDGIRIGILEKQTYMRRHTKMNGHHQSRHARAIGRIRISTMLEEQTHTRQIWRE